MTSQATTPAVGGTSRVPLPDPVARDYILLALRLDQHVPGLVDSYFGPSDLKAQVDLEQRTPAARLIEDAIGLRTRVASDVADPDRRDWLDAQLIALETHARVQAGEEIEYEEQVARFMGWRPERRPDSLFEESAAALEAILPGDGSVDERLAQWDARFVVEPERLPGVVDWLVDVFRRRSEPLFGLPDGESLRVSLVRDQPWSGYNWYDGGLRSRVDINLDLPIRAADLAHTVAHETFPGHHLEHAWKEADLVVDRGRLENSVLVTNAPECLVSEGLANLGRRVVIPESDEVDLLAELFTRAGLQTAGDEAAAREAALTTVALAEPRRRLGEILVNVALHRHADGWSHDRVAEHLRDVGRMPADRIEKRLEFVEHPIWRTYIFVYSEGEALLERWVDLVPREARAARFGRLLHEQLTPRSIAAELAG